ncbi:AraC family transcriptional regulator [Catenuloplanes sp. NPDC020197]|uniref:AraC family transcriptional regulator n=1 Tax=Catenuloplanes sp. NPDC020197 TaxID=3363958 RepID=UPI0037884CA4
MITCSFVGCPRAAKPARRRSPGPAAVAAVARRWGLTDAAHYSKAFRAAYGLSPREWRAVRRAV